MHVTVIVPREGGVADETTGGGGVKMGEGQNYSVGARLPKLERDEKSTPLSTCQVTRILAQ